MPETECDGLRVVRLDQYIIEELFAAPAGVFPRASELEGCVLAVPHPVEQRHAALLSASRLGLTRVDELSGQALTFPRKPYSLLPAGALAI